MRVFINSCLVGLCALLASQSAFSAVCKENIQVSNPWDALSSDQWQSNCESVTRMDTSDPYNPKPALAKYYTFTLERDADVRFQLDPQYSSYSRRFNIIEGSSEYGNVLFSNQYRTLETRLSAGTYTFEASYVYGSSFQYQVSFNDTAVNNECVQAISAGTPISDGWISACESTSRDVIDPYNTIPGEGHRTKYFTFSLQDHTDIRIDIDSRVNTHIYILSGTGEHAVPYEDFSSEPVTSSLPQGDYTIEVTTDQRYAPGQFIIELNTYINAGGCSQDLSLGSAISGSWSENCEIRSWLDENGDPYQGDGPERANYHSFTLTEAKELRFRLTGQNDRNTIFSLYEAGNYLNKLATTQASYWGNPSSEFSIRLEAGSYELEVTKYNEVAIGSYTISSYVFENDDCINSISLGTTEEAYLASGCESLFRIVDGGMDDPYGAQPGTYYAKRFEFTLDEPSTIAMGAQTSSNSGYIYLAKRINGQWQRLTESWIENYWNTTSSPSIHRTLDAGTYMMEVTSYYPEKEGPITARVQVSSSASCDSYLALNARTFDTLGSGSNCLSEFKSSYYNYDPYGPNNGYQHYYAKSYTFEIGQAGTYSIIGSSNSFTTNLYLIEGGDVKGQLLTEQASGGDNTISQSLDPGLYTVEITALTAGSRGAFSILVWDGTSDIEEGVETNHCIQVLPEDESLFDLFGTWVAGCDSENRSGKYAKYYDFNIVGNSAIDVTIDLSSSADTYLYLLQWNGSSWVVVQSDDDSAGGYNSKIQSQLTAGSYRIEATTFESSVQADFQLRLNIQYPDLDGDGIFDDVDVFPNDASEWLDSDGDNVGDNSDEFPENAQESVDTDNDGIGNNADIDDDNDGVFDYLDALPLNSDSSLDSDFDGIADEVDDYPYPYAGDIRFAVKSVQVAENGETATVVIERIGEPFLDANIFFYTEDDSAVANVDYKPLNGNLEFGTHVNSHSLDVELINNDGYSGDRSFFIKLAFPSTFVSNSQGTVAEITISDDDDLPSAGVISFSATSLSVNENDSSVNVEIVRSEGAIGEAIVAVSTLDDTAFASSDYDALSDVITFSEGELSKTISVKVLNDDTFEDQETLLMSLTSLTEEAVVIDKTQVINIVDDDIAPDAGNVSLVINTMTISEQSGDIVFALQRPAGSVGEVQLNWVAIGQDSLSGVVLQTESGSILFKDGDVYKPIVLTLVKESEVFSGMSNEVCIKLSLASSGAHLSDKKFCLILQEVDRPEESGFITFSGTSYRVSEGEAATLTLNRLFASNVTETVPLYVYTESDQAKSGLDFSKYDQNIDFLLEEKFKTLVIESNNDDEFEGAEKYFVRMEKEGITQSVSVHIIDDESKASESGLFRFSGSQYSVDEDQGVASVVVQRVSGFSGQVMLELNMNDGTAIANQDYNDDIKLIVFEDGESSKTIEIEIYSDSKSHEGKFFSISLNAGSTDLLLAPHTARITINNVDVSAKEDKEDKEDKGFLGLGSLSPLWMLLLLLPTCFVRVRRVEALR